MVLVGDRSIPDQHRESRLTPIHKKGMTVTDTFGNDPLDMTRRLRRSTGRHAQPTTRYRYYDMFSPVSGWVTPLRPKHRRAVKSW